MVVRFRVYIALLLVIASSSAMGTNDPARQATPTKVDRVIITSGSVNRRFFDEYYYEVLQLALEHSEAEYGPFSIEVYDADIITARVLRELEVGADEGRVNVHIATTSNLKEQRLDTIHVPLRMGLLGYRLLVVHKKNVEAFSQINTLDELRKYRVGSGARWTTTSILKQKNLSVVEFSNHDSMYSMLERGRFDFVLRGVSEIYHELESCGEACRDLAIVPGAQVYLPVQYHIFVSKSHPKIFKRIEAGLLAAVRDGSFKSVFLKHHLDFLKRAKMDRRRVISIPNPDSDPALETPAFWFSLCDMSDATIQPACAEFSEILATPNAAVNPG